MRSMQNALILNLIVFLTGVVTHNIMLTDFSYEHFLDNMIDTSMLAGAQSFFTLHNSSPIITGVLVVFAYTALYSLARIVFGIKHSDVVAEI